MAVAKSKGVKGRIEVVPSGRDFTIIIDYAHSPDGLENIITSLKEIAKGRVVTFSVAAETEIKQSALRWVRLPQNYPITAL